MLKLVFYIKDLTLKVRLSLPGDDFTHACTWKNKLTFIVSDSGDFTMIWTSLLPDLDPEYAETLVDLISARYPLSSQYDDLKKNCPALIFHNPSNEWVFFGGSFHPWHQGHQSCLTLLPEDKVCLTLPDRNPQKEPRDIHTVSTLLEISTKAKFKKLQFLVPTFLLKPEKNPTSYWISDLKAKMPGEKLSLLMGFDSFSSITSWIKSEELVKHLYAIYVVSRLEDEGDRIQAKDVVHAMNPQLNVVFLGKHAFENLSSTELRKR